MKNARIALLAIGFVLLLHSGTAWGQKEELPEHVELQLIGGQVEKFDFEQKGIEGWKTVDGRWSVEEAKDAPSGKRVLVQRALKNTFNVIVAPAGPYTDVDVSVRFKPISGQIDASGGIVFRFLDGRYYVVRANALEAILDCITTTKSGTRSLLQT